MNFRSLIITLCFLFIILPAISQVSEFDTELKILRQLEIMEFREKIPLVYDSLRKVPDYDRRIKVGDALFDLTEKKDPVSHIHSLLFRASISKKNPESLFNQAYNLSEIYGDIDDINNVEHSRAVYYMNKRQYDSAMVFILRYREKVGPDITGEGYREINNLLGDIYYQAGLLDKAREVYTELLHQYELEENWNYFRPYVMMNNIGQIFLKNGNISKAHEEFNRSLKLAEDHLKTPYRNNSIGYIKIKLAETALANNNVEEAERFLNEVADYPENDIYEDVKQEWIFCMARLLLNQGNPNDAKQYAEQLIPEGKQLYSEYRFVPEVYHLLAEIYSDLGFYEVAMNYDRKFDKIKDSLRISKHLTGSMIVIADYNEKLTKQELDKSQQRTSFIIKIFVILIAALFIILFFYFRLYKSKLELVKKVIENNQDLESIVSEMNTSETSFNENEIWQQKVFIKELKSWMESEKPYLDPGLNITDVALHLKTNRTYLSRAINNQLNTSFPNFINEYRIKESIRLILSGFTHGYTQEALAKKSGFAGRNVFNTAFKKYTGVVPSFFIANCHNWDVHKERFLDPE